MRHGLVRRLGRSHRRPLPLVPAALTAAGAAAGVRLLAGAYTVFQHAYLGSYWAVPGAQVQSAYWASVRFAFGETILVAVGIGALTLLGALALGRSAGR